MLENLDKVQLLKNIQKNPQGYKTLKEHWMAQANVIKTIPENQLKDAADLLEKNESMAGLASILRALPEQTQLKFAETAPELVYSTYWHTEIKNPLLGWMLEKTLEKPEMVDTLEALAYNENLTAEQELKILENMETANASVGLLHVRGKTDTPPVEMSEKLINKQFKLATEHEYDWTEEYLYELLAVFFNQKAASKQLKLQCIDVVVENYSASDAGDFLELCEDAVSPELIELLLSDPNYLNIHHAVLTLKAANTTGSVYSYFTDLLNRNILDLSPELVEEEENIGSPGGEIFYTLQASGCGLNVFSFVGVFCKSL